MIKYFFLALFTFNANAWISPDVFESKYINLEESLLKKTLKTKFNSASSALEEETVQYILQDKENKVGKDFVIPTYFDISVRFWFSIYTQFSSQQVVIHDKENLGLVYNIIDFSETHSADINRYSKAKIQSHLSLEYTRKLKKMLKKFSKSLRKVDDEEKGILAAIKKVHKIPKGQAARRNFFKNLANNIRTQTGQRDMIYKGMLRAKPYFDYLYKTIDSFKLPRELLAITFLESSFNLKAYSKVGAAGAWQFMPYISSLFMPRRSKYIDYRLNIIISTISAMHLLKQNKMILRTWDLAVPAYNSGTKHLVKAKKKFKKVKKLTLEYILENYDHAHIGFASQNFYSEFLALVHVLAYKDVIYPLKGFQDNKKRFNTANLNIYIAKCSTKPKKIFKLVRSSSPKFNELNTHFRYPNRTAKRGNFYVSDIKLTERKYYKLTTKEIIKNYPKYWHRYIRKKRCGRK